MRFCLALIIVALLINAVVDAGRKKNKEKGLKADRRIKAVCSVGKYFLSTSAAVLVITYPNFDTGNRSDLLWHRAAGWNVELIRNY